MGLQFAFKCIVICDRCNLLGLFQKNTMSPWNAVTGNVFFCGWLYFRIKNQGGGPLDVELNYIDCLYIKKRKYVRGWWQPVFEKKCFTLTTILQKQKFCSLPLINQFNRILMDWTIGRGFRVMPVNTWKGGRVRSKGTDVYI